MSSSYQTLVDAVNQVEHDQSLFESQLGTELQGALHAELVLLGGKMIKKIKMFVDMGKMFADSQQPDVISKMLQSIQEYVVLLMPPKVFGGFCPCLKPARFGPEYERQYLLTRSKVVAATFLVDAILLENKAEKFNMDSMHFADYANKMNSIFNLLSNISTKGNEQAREQAKNELLQAFEQVNKFMKVFEEETVEFRSECRRRLASTNELLTSHSSVEGSTITRRILVKAQSALQEIMNSAAGVSMSKAKEAIIELELLNKALKESRAMQVNEFNAMEGRMHASNIIDALMRLREDMEVIHSDANSKIRDSLKRWNTVKNQSALRPVVEYTEDLLPTAQLEVLQSMSSVGSNIGQTVGANRLISASKSVGQEIKGIGKDILGQDVISVAGTGGKAALNAVKFSAGLVANSVKKSKDFVQDTVTGGASSSAAHQTPTNNGRPQQPPGSGGGIFSFLD